MFFRNQAIEPRSFYVYDALNRLIEATGRENSQLGSRPPGPIAESFHVESFPTDREVRAYRQRYLYDSVGNFIAMRHSADGDRWTREYEMASDSNRLLRTWTGGNEIESVRYAYDLHGSMLNLDNVPASARIRWDWRDMIEHMDLGGGGEAWYAYDIGKQRTRKRIERETGAVEERVYFGGAELFRRHTPSGELVEEIETHHLFVDDQRVLLVDDVIETDSRTLGTGVLLRYQYGNHLGSVALELDETAQIIGCEEFHPYGTTAYHLVNRAVRSTAKRYRYTGMERDEESGLSYHTARYYLSWLGKWLSTDPELIVDSLNVYLFCRNDPMRRTDLHGTQSEDEVVGTVARYGDIARYVDQLRAIRSESGVRLSEHEHIRARINDYLATFDPTTGTSPVTRAVYRRMHTLTIPEDMARIKTSLDMDLRNRLRAAMASDSISDELLDELRRDLSGEAAIERMRIAREQTMVIRRAAGASMDDLLAITDDRIAAAVVHQTSDLHAAGRAARQRVPIAEASEGEIDDALRLLEREGAMAEGAAARMTVRSALPALLADTGGSVRVGGLPGAILMTGMVLLSYESLRDAFERGEGGEFLFDLGVGLVLPLGPGMFIAASSANSTHASACELMASGTCRRLAEFVTSHPEASAAEIDQFLASLAEPVH